MRLGQVCGVVWYVLVLLDQRFEFLANEVPGIRVPELIVERMRRADAAGRASEEGLNIACEIAVEVRPLVQGVLISPAAGALRSGFGVMKALTECSRQ